MPANLTVYSFPGPDALTLQQAGGKALSLARCSGAGLPVPPGFVLPVEFFAAWFDQLKSTQLWSAFMQADSAGLSQACEALKSSADRLAFSREQETALADALSKFKDGSLFAVRSSSPEEDLEGSSFAGGYETVLGVSAEKIKPAVRRAFASCLDLRVVMYKREHGFDIYNPKIAVAVQQQIASEIAGVGFSINPVNNAYDEAVFNANWGLGETVVAGQVTPDSFIVNKLTGQVTSQDIGSKEVSIWLLPDGGTQERPNQRAGEVTLSGEQIQELISLVKRVEDFYQKPMDIEWAFSAGKLYLLQARPITSYVPLPQDLLTKPGEPRRLYLDVTISVQGIYKPLSQLGTSLIGKLVGTVRALFVSKTPVGLPDSGFWTENGRLYMVLTNIMSVAGRDRFAARFSRMDHLAAKTVLGLNEKEFTLAAGRSFRRHAIHFLWGIASTMIPHILSGLFSPEKTHERNCKELNKFAALARELFDQEAELSVFLDKLCKNLISTVTRYSMPVTVASRIALEQMKRMVPKADSGDLDCLELSWPNNPTTEMGLALSHISEVMPAGLTAAEMEERLGQSNLPPEFQELWQRFLNKYGHRGPVEIDVASPRYREDNRLLVDLLNVVRNAAGESPQERFDRNEARRCAAYEKLLAQVKQKKGSLQAKLFEKLYRCVVTLGGYRETHKYYYVLSIDLVRQRVLKEAATLCQAGRLKFREQVFDLTLDELIRGLKDPAFDLVSAADKNRGLIARLTGLPQLPTMIDSRGRILRPPTPETRPGEVVGVPISAGLAQGSIKVLHTANEKILNKGEILVARATDPGWTPLFVNAAAVILEIGGVLQHGALVAREYGLPCVAGVQNATELWADGTLVEVDGAAGIIRLLQQDEEQARSDNTTSIPCGSSA